MARPIARFVGHHPIVTCAVHVEQCAQVVRHRVYLRQTITHEIIIIMHEIRCRIRVSGKPINLRNKNRTAMCFCHTILEFAAAEKSLELHGRKIEINSS
jgi:hypothetical protein